MEKSFSILDAEAIEIIGQIRCTKSLGEKSKLKYQIIRCPVCRTESGKLTRTRAFCPECLKEFRIGENTHDDNYTVCLKCGKEKLKAYMGKNGICDYCRDTERNWGNGVCQLCGKSKLIRKTTQMCRTCNDKERRRKKIEKEGASDE